MVILNSYAYQIVCVPNIEKWNNVACLSGVNSTSSNGAANVACFDGIAFYKYDGRYFVATYPTFISLTRSQIDKMLIDNGYTPSNGDYATIFNSFGIVKEVSKIEFDNLMKSYPITKMDNILLGLE